VGQVFFAGEKAHERPALLRNLVAYCSAQHRIAGLERVEHRALRDFTMDVEFYVSAAGSRQRPQMCREYDSDHIGFIIVVSSQQRLDLDGKHGRKIADYGSPAISGIG
jgi:hypothetical protein